MPCKFLFRGLSDDADTCSRCGRTGLKRVAWLEVCDADGNGTGSVEAFGTSCAASALGWRERSVAGERRRLEVMDRRLRSTLLSRCGEAAARLLAAGSVERRWVFPDADRVPVCRLSVVLLPGERVRPGDEAGIAAALARVSARFPVLAAADLPGGCSALEAALAASV